MATLYNQIAGANRERIAALSDGLFAIAMTLIVLEIHVPPPGRTHGEYELVRALVALAPRLLTYGMSFMTLGIFWVGQQTQLNHLARANRSLAWWHLAFLAGVALMPFSTEFLAEFMTFRTALLLYWANTLMLGATLYGSWRYASRARLIRDDASGDVFRAVERRIVVAQSLYAVGAALCAINTYWSIGFIVAVQLNYAVGGRIPWISRWAS